MASQSRIESEIRRRLRPAVHRARDWRVQLQAKRTGAPPIPPRSLRDRVHGRPDAASFVETGRRCADDILGALARVDLPPKPQVLEFGCGSARVLGWIRTLRPDWRLSGSDIDAEALAWATAAHPTIHFSVNDRLPPLRAADDSVDVIYLISVFTHLDLPDQEAWLDEFHRLLRTGGTAIITVHGPAAIPLTPELLTEVGETGFLFLRSERWKGTFPEWYQTSVQTQAHTRAVVQRHGFDVVDYAPAGLNGHQDLVLLRAVAPSIES